MSDSPQHLSLASAREDVYAELGARLQGLDAQQALRVDPIRWRTALALWSRAQQARGALRAALLGRLSDHLDPLVRRMQDDTGATSGPNAGVSQARVRDRAWTAPLAAPGTPLASLAPMRQTHARIKIQQQLRHTLSQPLRHAGPLHSERLVQQSLARMNTWSQAYLLRFMSYLDALTVLEDALSIPRAPAPAKGAKSRGKIKATSTTKR